MKIPYGYEKNSFGDISINEEKAAVVRLIFQADQAGLSLGRISDLLAEQGVPSPSGNPKWTRAAIDKLLSNAKYIPIIGVESYLDAQYEEHDRSNIDEDTGQRKTVWHHPPEMSDGFDFSLR